MSININTSLYCLNTFKRQPIIQSKNNYSVLRNLKHMETKCMTQHEFSEGRNKSILLLQNSSTICEVI